MTISWVRTGVILAAFSSPVFGCSSAEPGADGAEESVASESAELRAVCRPGSQRCSDATHSQTCNRYGRWNYPTRCKNGCSNGACNPDPGPDPEVASGLDGQMLLGPCVGVTGEANVCLSHVGSCPTPNVADPALSGALLTDKVITLGGDASKTYTITLRVQGVVEAKRYQGSADANNSAASPAANGFTAGGMPTQADAYGIWMVRVGNPAQDYFLNSLVPPGVSDHTTYGVDYTAQIQAKGGSTVRLVAADPNCSMIKNCGPVKGAGTCPNPLVVVPTAHAAELNPTFNFNTPFNGQWLVMTVTSVTSP